MQENGENRVNLNENQCPSLFKSSCTGIGYSEEADSLEKTQTGLGLGSAKTSTAKSTDADGWIKSLQLLPNLTSEKIDKQLIENSTLPKTTSAPGAFRNKWHGYRLWKEGFVRSILVKPNVGGHCLLFIAKARVHASMKNTFYNVYVHLDQSTADVIFAKCNCKAGQGGCCKHVPALLFTLLDFVNLDIKYVPNDLTCTQVSQKWHIPTSANTTLPKAVRFDDLQFEKAEVNKKRKRPGVSGIRESFCATPPFAYKVNAEDLKIMVEEFSKENQAYLFCAAVESNDYAPCVKFKTSVSRQLSKQEDVTSFNNKTNSAQITIEQLLGKLNFALDASLLEEELSEKILSTVAVTRQDVINICVNTLGQSEEAQWFTERKMRLTASIFGRVINRKTNIYPASLIKCIVSRAFNGNKVVPASLQWGLDKESVAISEYERHPDFCGDNVQPCGFVVLPSCPWLGCSPDDFVLKDGAPIGCIEVKCPYSKRDMTLNEAAKGKTFFYRKATMVFP